MLIETDKSIIARGDEIKEALVLVWDDPPTLSGPSHKIVSVSVKEEKINAREKKIIVEEKFTYRTTLSSSADQYKLWSKRSHDSGLYMISQKGAGIIKEKLEEEPDRGSRYGFVISTTAKFEFNAKARERVKDGFFQLKKPEKLWEFLEPQIEKLGNSDKDNEARRLFSEFKNDPERKSSFSLYDDTWSRKIMSSGENDLNLKTCVVFPKKLEEFSQGINESFSLFKIGQEETLEGFVKRKKEDLGEIVQNRVEAWVIFGSKPNLDNIYFNQQGVDNLTELIMKKLGRRLSVYAFDDLIILWDERKGNVSISLELLEEEEKNQRRLAENSDIKQAARGILDFILTPNKPTKLPPASASSAISTSALHRSIKSVQQSLEKSPTNSTESKKTEWQKELKRVLASATKSKEEKSLELNSLANKIKKSHSSHDSLPSSIALDRSASSATNSNSQSSKSFPWIVSISLVLLISLGILVVWYRRNRVKKS